MDYELDHFDKHWSDEDLENKTRNKKYNGFY